MKKLIPLALLALTGCSSTNIANLTKELAKDPAAVHIRVTSIYGTLDFTRVGDLTNQVTMSPDGTVQIKK